MKEGQRLWTREELILALNLYLKLPFGKLHSRTPEIIHLAKLIDRNANAVAMRLNNFASVDPYGKWPGILSRLKIEIFVNRLKFQTHEKDQTQ
jgi:putative restriction endonuclease